MMMSVITKIIKLKLGKKYAISDDGFLVGRVKRILSPNTGSELDLKKSPLYVILHYTATKDAYTANKILCDRAREVSAHLVIDRNAKVYQLVPFNKIAWHAGTSSWKDITALNKYSIGIELVNAGKLERAGREFLTWDNKIVPKKQVIKKIEENGIVSYWHNFPRKQMDALDRILGLLKSKYEINEVLMHSEISPGRKVDPGPAFPIERFRTKS